MSEISEREVTQTTTMYQFSPARERHAQYYVARTREAIASDDLHQIEINLPNLQRAWLWVSEQSNDIELLLEYGRLAWRLFDLFRERLNEVMYAMQHLQLSSPDALNLRSITDKLDELLHAQAQIQAVLELDSRFSVKIEHAYGVAIGDKARVEIQPPSKL